MIGITANARPIPAVNALSRNSKPKVDCNHDASTINTKKPITTDGMAANISIAGLIHSRYGPGANSAVYKAAARASGVAMRSAIRVILSVPNTSGMTLYLGEVDTGCQVNGAVNGVDRDIPSTDWVTSGNASRAT